MKVLFSVISAAAIVVAAAGVSHAGIGFRATGGYSHISYGDFNDWVDEANESLAAGGAGEIDNIKWRSRRRSRDNDGKFGVFLL
ncbi:MAG: hypothetical protein MUF59_07070 [Candidatus Krumholzibacteria bacterium]|nr:hypothetical protein [Candidatus Krumholzibacteria bacterium]